VDTRTEQETDHFKVRSNTGEESAVIEYTIFINRQTREGCHRTPGVKRLYTTDGECVHAVCDGEYELVSSTERFKRI
jgi:hypothetical protein